MENSNKKITLTGVFFLLFLFIFFINNSYCFNCTAHTYNNNSWTNQSTLFEVGDKVYVKITCNDLHKGNYLARINWIKENYGVVRTDTYQFTSPLQENRNIFFWMSVDKKSFLSSMLSFDEYNEDMLGDWRVESFLEEELVATSVFHLD